MRPLLSTANNRKPTALLAVRHCLCNEFAAAVLNPVARTSMCSVVLARQSASKYAAFDRTVPRSTGRGGRPTTPTSSGVPLLLKVRGKADMLLLGVASSIEQLGVASSSEPAAAATAEASLRQVAAASAGSSFLRRLPNIAAARGLM